MELKMTRKETSLLIKINGWKTEGKCVIKARGNGEIEGNERVNMGIMEKMVGKLKIKTEMEVPEDGG